MAIYYYYRGSYIQIGDLLFYFYSKDPEKLETSTTVPHQVLVTSTNKSHGLCHMK